MTSYLVDEIRAVLLLSILFFSSCDSKPKKARKKVNIPAPTEEISFIKLDSIQTAPIKTEEFLEFKAQMDSMVTQMMTDSDIKGVAIEFTDLNSRQSFSVNPELKFVPASLLKIPILIAIFKLEELKPGVLNTQLPLRMVDPGITDMNLEENFGYNYSDSKNYSANELCEIMMSHSDNIATYTLLIFLDEQMPGLLQKVEADLRASIPETATNKDDIIKIGHFAEMLHSLYYASYLTKEHSIKALKYLSRSKYGQGFRKSIPSYITMAHKYGVRFNVDEINPLFPVQLHQVAIIYHPKHPFILSVMSKGKKIEKLREVLQRIAKISFEKVNSLH